MNICKIDVSNFRGIKNASILVSKNAVFVGDNNSGKSTLFEAIDLVMGPDRLSRSPVIDEHDFYAGEYLANDTPVQIKIEVTVIGLSEDQKIYFGNHIEWWDRCKGALISGPPASSTDVESVEPALRLAFQGNYNLEEDDFEGQTYFAETLREGSTPELFRKKDKRNCGFLYLRTLRTGSRALSLERGSLLDIILQMKEVKPQMWEDVLKQLKGVSVANESELGVSDILTSVFVCIPDLFKGVLTDGVFNPASISLCNFRVNASCDKLLCKELMPLINFFGNIPACFGQMQNVITIYR